MIENRKQILDVFQEKIDEAYTEYCQRHDKYPSTKGLITFLIDKNIIPSVVIKRYAVSREFDEMLPQNDGHKTKTVNRLADRFNIPERTIWSIIKKKDNSK